MPRHPDAFCRFEANILVDGDGCWLWTASLNNAGYPRFHWNGRSGYAHRFSYEHFHAIIPDGYVVDHKCRVSACVNPNHLQAITVHENSRKDNPNIHKTHCPQGHPYTKENTLGTKRRSRQCKTCARERQRIKQNWQGGPHNRDKTHCKHGHEFTSENTYVRPDRGTRECRECARIRNRG